MRLHPLSVRGWGTAPQQPDMSSPHQGGSEAETQRPAAADMRGTDEKNTVLLVPGKGAVVRDHDAPSTKPFGVPSTMVCTVLGD